MDHENGAHRRTRLIREAGHRSEAGRRPQERLCLRLTYREAIRDAMSEAMRRDEDVFVMGEDIAEMGGSMGVTQGMLDEFGPDRVRNTPISEMAIVGAGIGAAVAGMRPIVEVMYQDFMTLAMEQLVQQAAKHRYMSGGRSRCRSRCGRRAAPAVARRTTCPAARGVVRPRPRGQGGVRLDSRRRARAPLGSIYDDNPVVFFPVRTLYNLKGEVPDEIDGIEIGKARIHREGDDVTVVATGRLVHESGDGHRRSGVRRDLGRGR